MAITKLWNIGAAGGENPSASLYRSLVYIANPKKTDGGSLVGSNLCIPTALEAYRTMVHTKKIWNKIDERQGYHIVISFSPDEKVNARLAMTIAQEFTQRYLGREYEALYAVHTDQEHMHIHLIFNSVSGLDGHKYHYNNGDWRRSIQPLVNHICAEHGLTQLPLEDLDFTANMEQVVIDKVLVKGRRLSKEEWLEQKAGLHTWAEFIAADIDSLLPTARNYEDIIRGLQNIGWQVRWKTKDGSSYLKHYAVRPPHWICEAEQNMAWRRPDRKCGYGYSREGLELRIKYGIWKIDEIETTEFEEYEQYDQWKMVSAIPKEYIHKQTMTDYQRKYFAMLYRTGQMNRRKANRIPMEWRCEVRKINETRKMVEYLMRSGLKSEVQVRKKMDNLYLELMKAEKAKQKSVVKELGVEIKVCKSILEKSFIDLKEEKEIQNDIPQR